MKIITKTIEINTKNEFEILNITDKVKEIIKNSKIKEGFVNIFSRHTTLAIKINEDEKLLLKDFENILRKISDLEKEYFHDKIELRNCPADEPKNARSHIKCLLLETSQIIPLKDNKMLLGTYQNIFAIETSGPRKREIIIQVCGE